MTSIVIRGNERKASRLCNNTGDVGSCKMRIHHTPPPVGGTTRHRKCDQHNHTIISEPSRDAKSRLLSWWLLIPIGPRWSGLGFEAGWFHVRNPISMKSLSVWGLLPVISYVVD
ncbi:hypothetical protein AVEN_59127-1 [Araneus ventricosus]|uniref:Uncharacterized protein n=1 Tax=Araneus ventricosus TaxID=182803 RepID=A0A4Y2MR08_ARAVE|nr:hypothetical protein AVEN_59127-1 [Araneus ventricosus]